MFSPYSRLPSISHALSQNAGGEEDANTLAPLDRRRSFLYATAPASFAQVPPQESFQYHDVSPSYQFPPRPAYQQDMFTSATSMTFNDPRPRRTSGSDMSSYSFSSASSASSSHTTNSSVYESPHFTSSNFYCPPSPVQVTKRGTITGIFNREATSPRKTCITFPAPPEGDASASFKPKARSTFTPQQISILEDLLKRAAYPSSDDVCHATQLTGLTEKQIKTWLSNRRAGRSGQTSLSGFRNNRPDQQKSLASPYSASPYSVF